MPMRIPPQGEADQPSITFRAADLLVDTGRQRVTRNGVTITVPKLSYELLLVLIRASPDLVSNDELLDKVWPKSVVSPETLSQRIKLLRDALGDNPRSPIYVEGLRGRGYRLIPIVERVAGAVPATDMPVPAPQTEVVAPSPDDPAQVVVTAEHKPEQRTLSRRVAVFSVLALLVLAVAVTGISLYRGHAQEPKTSVEVVAVQPRAVAVLPFDNLSEAPGSQYVALGIAESVLNQLGSVRELIVIARSSSFSLGILRPDAQEVASRLGVQHLVQGSVQRAGSRLRVNAQLVDAVGNREMWSLSLDRDLDDVFAMQDEIATRVAEKLEVSLSKLRPGYAAFDTEAYLAYLHGRALVESRKVDDVQAAIAEFSQALQLAPNFAAAMIGLAQPKLQLASVRADFYRTKDTLLPELESLVDRAIGIDPGEGAAYFMRAHLKVAVKGPPEQSEADFRKGLELAPNYAFGIFNYGAFLWELGRNEEALALLDKASLLDPMAASTHYLRGQVLFYGYGRLDESIASYRQALAAAPDYYPAHIRLSAPLFFKGNLAEAIQAGEKAIAIEPKAGWVREQLMWLYLHLDDLDAARELQRGFDPSDSNGRLDVALLCYRAGKLDATGRILRSAIKDPDVEAGITMQLAVEATVEQARARGKVDAARELILSIPELTKEHGHLAMTEENWGYLAVMATLEKQGGNVGEGKRTAGQLLDWAEHGNVHGAAGLDDWTRASALAILERNDEAMLAL